MVRGKPRTVRITSATRSHSDDIRSRERRYILTMGVRTVCFVLTVVVFLAGAPAWVVWTFFLGSLLLPYIAVVMANAGVSPDPGGPDPFDAHPERREIQGASPAEDEDS